MKDSFFTLAPERVQFDQFWVEIRKRNLWLIKLRYGAFFLLTSLITGIYALSMIFGEFSLNTFPLWVIAFSIFIYNIIFHKIWKYLSIKRKWHLEKSSVFIKRKFNSLHFSLIQISTDFISLMLFIYFSGGVETPLYLFFIFHVIIGSLFIPGQVIYTLVTVTLITTLTGSILELNGIIPHHAVNGMLSQPLYNNQAYLIVFYLFFAIALYLSIYLANSISKELYVQERALTIALKDLKEAEKSKSRYVMSVVHDLKTPAAAVITYLNMLLDGTFGNLTKEQERPVERSKIRLSNSLGMINDILYISQLKLESDTENKEDVNLSQLLNEISTEMKVLIDSKEINFTLTLPKTELILKSEYKFLKLALSNLLSNAIKYTETNGKIEIIVSESDERISISIADNGIGIPQEEQNKIFQDFFRTSLSKKMGIEGTGLGLSIVQEIIKRNNGKIRVISPSSLKTRDEFPGTEFIIDIPKLI